MQRLSRSVLCLFVTLASGLPAFAGTVTNLTTGACYDTIQAAVDEATAGDELVLAPGVHSGLGNTNVSFGGKDLVLRGATADPADVVVDCLNVAETRGFSFHSGETRAAVLADLTIANGNMSTGPGGGIFIDDASPTIRNCAFVGNRTEVWGGGLFHDHGNALVVDCTFTDNIGVQDGGGMFHGFGSASVVGCTFTGNAARNGGGLIMNAGGTEVSGCTFVRNTALFNSGGLHVGIAAVPVRDCVFVGNTAGLRAGGLFTGAGTFDVVNCVFVGNTSMRFGGGLFNSTARPSVIHCTFVANTATEAGGGIYSDFQPSRVRNSILWGDSPEEVAINSGAVEIEYSDVLGGYPGSGNIDVAPLFVRDPAPGLDGAWGTADDDYGDLHLISGSACIDAGDNDSAAGIAADLDGEARFLDDAETPDTGNPGAQGAPIVDLGAFEVTRPDCNRNGVSDADDLASGASSDVDGNGVPDECDGIGEKYCVGAANSVSADGASLLAEGSVTVSDNDFTLVSYRLPDTFGLYFYGPTQIQSPFGDGFRCVGGATQRIQPVQPISGNTVSRTVDLSAAPHASHIGPASDLNFQLWYRDSGGPGGSGYNTSDAVHVVFE